jgi:hypothetical protein
MTRFKIWCELCAVLFLIKEVLKKESIPTSRGLTLWIQWASFDPRPGLRLKLMQHFCNLASGPRASSKALQLRVSKVCYDKYCSSESKGVSASLGRGWKRRGKHAKTWNLGWRHLQPTLQKPCFVGHGQGKKSSIETDSLTCIFFILGFFLPSADSKAVRRRLRKQFLTNPPPPDIIESQL